MSRLFQFSTVRTHDPAIETWMRAQPDASAAIARQWFEVMRECGDDVREILHDGHPTACVTDAAFAYVNAFTAHVNVGFFHGAALSDPAGLLQGTGKYMRHVKIKLNGTVNVQVLTALIETAYADMKNRLETEAAVKVSPSTGQPHR